MSGFSAQEIEEFEDVEFQSEKEARLDYYDHAIPLSRRHKEYLQQKSQQQHLGRHLGRHQVAIRSCQKRHEDDVEKGIWQRRYSRN